MLSSIIFTACKIFRAMDGDGKVFSIFIANTILHFCSSTFLTIPVHISFAFLFLDPLQNTMFQFIILLIYGAFVAAIDAIVGTLGTVASIVG